MALESLPSPAWEESRSRESGEESESESPGIAWQFWVMLLVSLCMVTGVTLLTRGSVQREAEHEFEAAGNEIQAIILYRLSEHARILWSGSAFFDASNQVSRREWHDFVARQRLNEVLPGIQGVGYSLLIPRADLASHQ
ncbi:MAG TPA: CHASE domain-containing protein, partial [Candidatus Ozemobacteraceae bacterium]|nr:CHASE domain-containing protein [Candidatus Ozemobacteraceae bacterium]